MHNVHLNLRWKWTYSVLFTIILIGAGIFFHCFDGNPTDWATSDIAMRIAPVADTGREYGTFYVNESIAVFIEVLETDLFTKLELGAIMEPPERVTEEIIRGSVRSVLLRGEIDTVNKLSINFDRPGRVLLTSCAHSKGSINIDTQYITIKEKYGNNLPPAIQLQPIHAYAAPTLPCSVKVILGNPEAWQKVTVDLRSLEKSVICIGDSLCIWTPETGDVGKVKELQITAIDNGNPQETASEKVFITVIRDSTVFSPPENIRITERIGNIIKIAWQEDILADGYKVYRSLTSSFDSVDTFFTEVASFSDTTEKIYYYQIATINVFGVSQSSLSIIGYNKALPKAPSDLFAKAIDTSTVNLTWIDNSSNETGFELSRCLMGDSGFSVISRVNANITSFTDSGLLAGMEYYYRVRALSADSSSEYSIVSVTSKVFCNLLVYQSIGGIVTSSPAMTMYNKGDTVTITAKPLDKNEFTGWMGDVKGKENPLIVVMNSNMTIIASFINRTPVFNRADTFIVAGDTLQFTITASDPDGDMVKVYAEDYPKGATFDIKNYLFTWIPKRDQIGDHIAKFIITDNVNPNVTDSMRIRVYAMPQIDLLKADREMCHGKNSVMKLMVSGSAPFKYQWKKDGYDISSANNDSLELISIIPENAGIYECVISNEYGTTVSKPCTLEVKSLPVITVHPASQLKFTDDSVEFHVAASGSIPISYQWRKNGIDIQGKNDSLLVLNDIALEDSGYYTCIISNNCGNVKSFDAQLSVDKRSAICDSCIVASSSVTCPGTPVTLTVKDGVLGSGAGWKWYVGGCGWGDPVGEGDTLVVVPNVKTTYYVRAEGEFVKSECKTATIAVQTPPSPPKRIKPVPETMTFTICKGSSLILEVDSGSLGTGGGNWAWYAGMCDGTAIGTETRITVAPETTTTYFVRAQGGSCGNSECKSVVVTITTPPTTPTILPGSVSICQNDSITLSVSGSLGSGGGSWIWYTGSCGGTAVRNGESIKVSPDTTTTYYVRAEGGNCRNSECGSASIAVRKLSIAPKSVLPGTIYICPGSSTTLTVNGGALGTDAKWRWYTDSLCTKPAASVASNESGSEFTVRPFSDSTYYVRAEGYKECNDITGTAKAYVYVYKKSRTPPKVSVNPSGNMCSGSQIKLSVLNGAQYIEPGAVWKWYKNKNCSDYIGSGEAITVTITSTTKYCVRAERGGTCPDTTGYAELTVNVAASPYCSNGLSKKALQKEKILSKSYQIGDF